jgi:hypothetical protein
MSARFFNSILGQVTAILGTGGVRVREHPGMDSLAVAGEIAMLAEIYSCSRLLTG